MLMGPRQLTGRVDKSGLPHERVIGTFDKMSEPKQLPIEIIDAILSFLKANNDLSALTAVARANRTMYDLAIPKLYETVTMTERNEDQIEYGTSNPLGSDNGTSDIGDHQEKLMIQVTTKRQSNSQPEKTSQLPSLERSYLIVRPKPLYPRPLDRSLRSS